MKYLAVECDVNVQVEVLPVPVIALVILGQTLALYQFALWHAAVLHVRFDDGYAVVLQVVVDDDGADAKVLVRRLVNGLFEVGVKFQHLKCFQNLCGQFNSE